VFDDKAVANTEYVVELGEEERKIRCLLRFRNTRKHWA
jgi:hypothetical protein